jgi:hypothetical protein
MRTAPAWCGVSCAATAAAAVSPAPPRAADRARLLLSPALPRAADRARLLLCRLPRRVRRIVRGCCVACPAGITSTAAYDVNVPFMQLEQHGWDIHAV